MNILLINVSLRPLSPVKMFPVGLGYIATAVKNAGYAFDLLDIDAYRYSDEEVERRIRRKKYDVVCLGCIVTGYRIVRDLAAAVRRHHPRALVVAGNTVASSVTDTLLGRTEVDVAVLGEGDETIVEILKAVEEAGDLAEVRGICLRKEGSIVRTPRRPPIQDISSLPFIDFSLFDAELYITNAATYVSDPLPVPREEVRLLPVNTARGCVARCTFCYHVFDGMPYRFRSVENIVREVRELADRYAINYVGFSDELTFFSKKRALEFSEAIIQSGLRFYWVINCRGDLFDREEDIEIILKMKEAGCISVGYSLESSDPGILRAMNKKITAEDFSRQTQLFHRAGMPVVTSLVLGYPQETPETIRATFDCCIENRIYPSSGYLLPQPGSKMYEYAREHGFIRDEEEYLLLMGDRQDLRVNMTTMTDEEFERHVLEGLKRCNTILEVGLDEDNLIKTQYYRAKDKVLET